VIEVELKENADMGFIMSSHHLIQPQRQSIAMVGGLDTVFCVWVPLCTQYKKFIDLRPPFSSPNHHVLSIYDDLQMKKDRQKLSISNR
jgi:hypothetical protein